MPLYHSDITDLETVQVFRGERTPDKDIHCPATPNNTVLLGKCINNPQNRIVNPSRHLEIHAKSQ